MTTHKHPGAPPPSLDGSPLRIAIVHARWNPTIITPLVSGCRSALLSTGVLAENIHTESVPGSWELPLACQRLYAASQTQSALSLSGGGISGSGASGGLGGGVNLLSAGDLLGASASTENLQREEEAAKEKAEEKKKGGKAGLTKPFDAIVAIGVLIKGETKHFEYICKAATQGLMKVQLETGVPVVLGVLTCLDEGQALRRAGVGDGKEEGVHNHGEDWGRAAVEMAVKRKAWGEGILG